MSIKTHSTYTYEHDEENTFPLPFKPSDDPQHVFISEDGNRAVLAFLDQDQDACDPFEAYDEGEFYQFNNRYTHHTSRPEIDEFKRIIRENPDRVFTHNGTDDWHGPGTTKCYPTAGPFTVADTKNPARDKASAAELALDRADGYYIVPEDATDPAAYAKSALETYSQWCNGEVYGVIVWTYTRDSTDDPWPDPDRDNECWGFIGYDYASTELKEQFDATVKRED